MTFNVRFENDFNPNDPVELNICIGMKDGRYVATVEVEDTPQQEITEGSEAHPVSAHDRNFHPALNLPKMKEGLSALLAAKKTDGLPLFDLQKQWYVVFKVLKEMDWLDPATLAKDFRAWAGEVYGSRGYCTKGDFDSVNGYYKKHASQQWTAESKVDDRYTDVARWMWTNLSRHEHHYLTAYLAHDLKCPAKR